jgi:DNA-binding MarR family transcriptional regulator
MEAARLADLLTQLMSKTLSQRLLDELPEARRLELTLAQLQTLRYVWLHRCVRTGDLMEGLAVTFPSATNMVKRLVEKKLLHRRVSPEDRRQIEITLTEQGSQLIERLERERLARLTAILEQMPAPERAGFLQGMRQFIRLAVGGDDNTASEICLRCGWRATPDCPLAETIPLFPCR